jgi:sugar lactone lactonase YvrE
MKSLRLFCVAGVVAIALTACAASNAPMVTPGSSNQTQATLHDGVGPNGVPSHISSLHGWMSPERKKKKKLLYVSDEAHGIVDIFSVPKYSMVGQITDGINQPEGLATDKKGKLYVSNLSGNTITVYKPGATSPSLTLTDSDGPDDVAVGSDGYIYAADVAGGVDVYPPGATSPSTRLTNSALTYAAGVALDASNNLYADGNNGSGGAVVKYANASGSGTNLGLTGLLEPSGVIVDKHNNLVVSDFGLSEILIYPPGQTSPSGTITVPSADRSALNKPENVIYGPEGFNYGAGVYEYPGGTLVTTIPIGGFTTGAALTPVAAP